MKRDGDSWVVKADFRNAGEVPALMVQLDLRAGGEQVLPVLYEDNWFSLLPGEEKSVTIRCKDADTRSRKPQLQITNLLD